MCMYMHMLFSATKEGKQTKQTRDALIFQSLFTAMFQRMITLPVSVVTGIVRRIFGAVFQRLFACVSSGVTAGLITFHAQFLTRSSPNVDRCSKRHPKP